MGSHRALGLVSGILAVVAAGPGQAADGPSSGGSGGMATASIPAAVSGGPYWRYWPPYYQTIGPDGRPVTYVPPTWMPAPAVIIAPAPAPQAVPPWNGFGVAGPLPRGGMPAPARVDPPANAKKKVDPAKASQLVTYGDRLFRAGNIPRAAERYEQAARTNPGAAAPRVRLAQVALCRGQYAEAANRYREAQAAEPDWLARATDIQSIYGEPGDFARQVARLESHLQAEPADRDGWLVLGAQWFLSGRTRRAADVFLRLTDRQPDATLAAFLDASRPADRQQK